MLVFATVFLVAASSTAKNTTQHASDPEIEWIQTFDSIINDRAYYVEQTADGGYIFTGSTIATPPGYTELLLVKTDATGELSWQHHFPIAETNLFGNVVHQTTDGGYIIVGSVGGSWLWDVQVTKADANGDLVWQKSFGKSSGPDHGYDILQTSDGGYLALGGTSTYGQGGYDLWLIKLTADGTEQWNKTIGGATMEEPKSFTKAVDGGYVIVGITDASDDMGDMLVVKTNDAGDVSWQKTFGNPESGEDGICIKTVSNGYIVLGSLYDMNGTESLWVIHLDSQGTVTWDRQIAANGSLHGTSITPTTDGGYFITGTLFDMVNWVSDVYLVKLNTQGSTQWDKILDISDGLCDEANAGIQARDGGYVVVGSTGNLHDWEGDTFLLKIQAEAGVVLDSVTAGLGVHAHLKNLGTQDATEVSVSIQITGGLLHLINVSYTETLSIPAGEDTTVSCNPFLGFGPLDITVTVNDIASDYTGRQLIIFTQLHS